MVPRLRGCARGGRGHCAFSRDDILRSNFRRRCRRCMWASVAQAGQSGAASIPEALAPLPTAWRRITSRRHGARPYRMASAPTPGLYTRISTKFPAIGSPLHCGVCRVPSSRCLRTPRPRPTPSGPATPGRHGQIGTMLPCDSPGRQHDKAGRLAGSGTPPSFSRQRAWPDLRPGQVRCRQSGVVAIMLGSARPCRRSAGSTSMAELTFWTRPKSAGAGALVDDARTTRPRA